MTKFRDLIFEVAEPIPGDEKRFKDKHKPEVIDDPNATDVQFDGGDIKKFVNLADYRPGEDVKVYESKEPDLIDDEPVRAPNPRTKIALTTRFFEPNRSKSDQIMRNVIESLLKDPVVPDGEDLETSHLEYKRKNEKGHTGEPLQELNAEELIKFYKRFRRVKKLKEENGFFVFEDGSKIYAPTAINVLNHTYDRLNEDLQIDLVNLITDDYRLFQSALNISRELYHE